MKVEDAIAAKLRKADAYYGEESELRSAFRE